MYVRLTALLVPKLSITLMTLSVQQRAIVIFLSRIRGIGGSGSYHSTVSNGQVSDLLSLLMIQNGLGAFVGQVLIAVVNVAAAQQRGQVAVGLWPCRRYGGLNDDGSWLNHRRALLQGLDLLPHHLVNTLTGELLRANNYFPAAQGLGPDGIALGHQHRLLAVAHGNCRRRRRRGRCRCACMPIAFALVYR